MKQWKKDAIAMAFETDKSWRQIAKVVGKPKSTVSDLLRKCKQEGYIHTPVSPESVKDKLKFLFLDIETSLIKMYSFGIWNQNIPIGNIIEDWYLLCFSYMWLGDEDTDVKNESIHNYPKGETGRYKDNEYLIVLKAWQLLDDCNYLCGWNLKKFDKKKLNAKFFEYGLPEPSPYKVVDPMLIAKGNFSLTSNKLDFVTKLMGHDGKNKTDMALWRDCMADDEKALDYMAEYCDKDVVELKDTYLKLRHWDKNAPQMAIHYDDDKVRCNSCGSDDLVPIKNKSYHTSLSSFNVLRCQGCGKVLRERTNTLSKEKRKSLLMNVPN